MRFYVEIVSTSAMQKQRMKLFNNICNLCLILLTVKNYSESLHRNRSCHSWSEWDRTLHIVYIYTQVQYYMYCMSSICYTYCTVLYSIVCTCSVLYTLYKYIYDPVNYSAFGSSCNPSLVGIHVFLSSNPGWGG